MHVCGGGGATDDDVGMSKCYVDFYNLNKGVYISKYVYLHDRYCIAGIFPFLGSV